VLFVVTLKTEKMTKPTLDPFVAEALPNVDIIVQDNIVAHRANILSAWKIGTPTYLQIQQILHAFDAEMKIPIHVYQHLSMFTLSEFFNWGFGTPTGDFRWHDLIQLKKAIPERSMIAWWKEYKKIHFPYANKMQNLVENRGFEQYGFLKLSIQLNEIADFFPEDNQRLLRQVTQERKSKAQLNVPLTATSLHLYFILAFAAHIMGNFLDKAILIAVYSRRKTLDNKHVSIAANICRSRAENDLLVDNKDLGQKHIGFPKVNHLFLTALAEYGPHSVNDIKRKHYLIKHEHKEIKRHPDKDKISFRQWTTRFGAEPPFGLSYRKNYLLRRKFPIYFEYVNHRYWLFIWTAKANKKGQDDVKIYKTNENAREGSLYEEFTSPSRWEETHHINLLTFRPEPTQVTGVPPTPPAPPLSPPTPPTPLSPASPLPPLPPLPPSPTQEKEEEGEGASEEEEFNEEEAKKQRQANISEREQYYLNFEHDKKEYIQHIEQVLVENDWTQQEVEEVLHPVLERLQQHEENILKTIPTIEIKQHFDRLLEEWGTLLLNIRSNLVPETLIEQDLTIPVVPSSFPTIEPSPLLPRSKRTTTRKPQGTPQEIKLLRQPKKTVLFSSRTQPPVLKEKEKKKEEAKKGGILKFFPSTITPVKAKPIPATNKEEEAKKKKKKKEDGKNKKAGKKRGRGGGRGGGGGKKRKT